MYVVNMLVLLVAHVQSELGLLDKVPPHDHAANNHAKWIQPCLVFLQYNKKTLLIALSHNLIQTQ